MISTIIKLDEVLIIAKCSKFDHPSALNAQGYDAMTDTLGNLDRPVLLAHCENGWRIDEWPSSENQD